MSTTKLIIYSFKLIILLPLILVVNLTKADIINEIDSINKLILVSKSDTSKVKLLLEITEKYYNSDTKKSREFANRAIDLANKSNWTLGKNLSLLKLGKIEYLIGNFDKSLEYNQSALNYFSKINDKEGIAVSSNQVGETYSKLQKDSLAIYYLNKSLAISKEIKKKILVKTNNTNLGALYAKKGQYNKSLNYYFEALKLQTKNQNGKIDAIINGNIGSIYLELGKFDDALKYYKKAIVINKKNNLKVSLAYNYFNLAILYSNLGKYYQSIEFFDKVLNLQNHINDNSMILDCVSSKATMLILLGKTSEAITIFKDCEDNLPKNLTPNDLSYFYFSYGSTLLDYFIKLNKNEGTFTKNILNDAIINLEKSKSYLGGQDLIKSDLKVYEYLYKAYKLNNKYSEALENLEIYQQQSESMFLNESIKSISDFENKLELEKKDKKLLLQKNKIKLAESKQLFITIALILTILLLILVIYLYNIKHKSNITLKFKNNEVNELNQTKDKLFSIVAHDLLNPIINFKNASEVLVNNYDSFTSDENKEYLSLIKQSSVSLLEMLRNLLDWSRSQRNKIETKIDYLSINQILLDNINLVQMASSQKSINIKHNFNSNFNALVDINLMTTVVRNVLSNAIKFTSENGEIDIKIEELENTTLIKIIDSGVGISQDKIAKIFELNTNNSTYGTNNEKGTGLGLVLCKEFMELMNGRITIESEVGKGTTVILQVPKK
jgi:signal transduction histidine kinase/tetratricopeptide (TPR) repeat protein